MALDKQEKQEIRGIAGFFFFKKTFDAILLFIISAYTGNFLITDVLISYVIKDSSSTLKSFFPPP